MARRRIFPRPENRRAEECDKKFRLIARRTSARQENRLRWSGQRGLKSAALRPLMAKRSSNRRKKNRRVFSRQQL